MVDLDFTPLYRTTIGFDRIPQLMQSATRMSEADLGYPPYNIEKDADDSYRIVIALAGFNKNDVEVVIEQSRLTVRGKMAEREGAEYLHRGIAGRSFERDFVLSEHIEVTGAEFDNGLLTIELKREIPEVLKPRKLEIGGVSANTKAIEHKNQQLA
ncbi:MAG: Hsp20 family protein [Hyphomicrobiaceae bacterium]